MTALRALALIAGTGAVAAARAAAEQSVHSPASHGASLIHEFGLAMYLSAGAIFLLVLVLAVLAVIGPARAVAVNAFLIGGGIVLPVAALTFLLIGALVVGDALSRPSGAPVARIQVIAHQWWWEVRYLPPARPVAELAVMLQRLCSQNAIVASGSQAPGADPDASGAIVLANEVRLPVGSPVEIELLTRDVIHSFWVPALGGKMDMIPGRVNRLRFQAMRAGTFRGQCAEYCGGPHGLMGLVVIAEEPAAYRRWLERQAEPARAPANAFLSQGWAAFMRSDCVDCHTVRGTPAAGTKGPDLTHVGSRQTIAAATLDNHPGTLAGWIADPQTIKPGNRMPPSTGLSGVELRALASYLASLD